MLGAGFLAAMSVSISVHQCISQLMPFVFCYSNELMDLCLNALLLK
jgi:hypothetical protein